ncbi:AraC family transcriptional regulator [Stutzerimonas nitrititolerans]|uniref:AraC family transcriptional regulator n=1 Tax=Stutzerimonas nitrititolerans TaxID=2482751 RepID=UPI0021596C60|nr:AraC family transcriptional regulator [Stutzerimonas nitrititolerans]
MKTDTAPMREQDSVAAYLVEAALHRLRDNPERMHQVLTRSGIDATMLKAPDALLPAAAVSRFWQVMAAELDDEFFGFDSHGLPGGSFALICRGLIHEPNLGKALQRCLQYLALFIRDIRGTLEVRSGQAVIGLDTQLPESTPRGAAEKIFLSIVLGLMCWLVGRRVPLNRSSFSSAARPGEATPRHWGPLVEYDAGRTEVAFDANHLKLPVIQDTAALGAFLRSCPQWLVVRFRNDASTASRILRTLRNLPSDEWPPLRAIARSEGISEQVLRRKLIKEGFTFQEIKHEARRALVFSLMRDPRLSISEIAALAGFQEPSALHRIFRRWTGESPGQFRSRLSLPKLER